ncbi:MAG TPA: MlaD family protein [Candidatus Omnitrophota bacterium]|nr:MlaD family protein [Candidatus Omnitrophota bacterium]
MKKANKALIGSFVIGALALLVTGIIIFGSGTFFKQSDKYILFFNGSVKGLTVGAPVIFRGVKIGNVSEMGLLYNIEEKNVLIPVVIDIELSLVKGLPDSYGYPDFKKLIDEGLRAKLEIQNFITGQLMIGLDFYPEEEPKIYYITNKYPELPALPISSGIFSTMNELPIKEISLDLKQAIEGINRIVNSEGISELHNLIWEVSEAAKSTRLLAEYLEQHPEALLKGKQGE